MKIIGFFQCSNRNRGRESEGGTSNDNKQETQLGILDARADSRSEMVPRYTKLDFPTFDGFEDPLVWLHRCEIFFFLSKTLELEKVGLAAFHMVKEAQLWYYHIEQEEPNLPWVTFKEYCTLCFAPLLHGNPLCELVNLK